MYTKIQKKTQNKFLTRFNTSIHDSEDSERYKSHNISLNSNSYQNNWQQSIDNTKYLQHIRFLQKRLITLEQTNCKLMETSSRLEKQKYKLLDKNQRMSKKQQQLYTQLSHQNQTLTQCKQDKQLKILYRQITEIQHQLSHSSNKIDKKTSHSKGRIKKYPYHTHIRGYTKCALSRSDNPQSITRSLQLSPSTQNIQQSSKPPAIKNLNIDKCIAYCYKGEKLNQQYNIQENMNLVKDKQYSEQIKKLQSAVYYLNKKLQIQTKQNQQKKQMIIQKQQIVKNFARQNRLLTQKIQVLEREAMEYQTQYSQNLLNSNATIVNIKQDLQKIIHSQKQQLEQKEANLSNERIKAQIISKQYELSQVKLNRIQEQNKQLKVQISALTIETKQYNLQLKIKARQISQLQNQLKQLKQKLNTSQIQKEVELQNRSETTQLITKLNTQLKDRAEFIKKLKISHEQTLSAVTKSMKQNQQRLVNSNQNLMSELSHKNQSIRQLNYQISALSVQNQSQSQVISNITNQMQHIKQFLDRGKLDCSTQSESTQYTMEQMQAGIEQLIKQKDENLSALQQQKQDILNSMQQLDRQYQKVLAESQNNQLYLQAAKMKIQQLNEQLQKSQQQIKQQQQQISCLRKQVHDLQQKQISYQEYIQNLKT